MKSIRVVLLSLAAACLLLVGVGAAAAYDYKISLLGDSITDYGYARYMHPILNDNSINGVKYEWDVINHGMPGYKASQLYNIAARQGWRNQDADVVIIMIGTNDMVHGVGKDRDSIVGGVISYVQALSDLMTFDNDPNRPRVIVSSIIPSLDPGISELADFYNKELKNALTGLPVDLFITSNWYEFIDKNTGGVRGDMYGDYLHPTQDGYYAMAENMFDAVKCLYNPDLINGNSYVYKMPNYKQI